MACTFALIVLSTLETRFRHSHRISHSQQCLTVLHTADSEESLHKCKWVIFVRCHLIPKTENRLESLSTLVLSPDRPEKRKEGLSVLSDISCHMGRGLLQKNVIQRTAARREGAFEELLPIF